jgi:DNA/RNA endonuclease YhcR with UshA esterase domain
MANPNIVAVTAIVGNTSTNLISSTSDPFATALVNNAVSSGKVYKINSIVVANVDGTSAADITIKIFSQDDLGGTGTAIASTISVPADASLIVTDKTTSFYLLEDKSIGATASAANDLVVTVSWEEITGPAP